MTFEASPAWPRVALGDHVDLLAGYAFKSADFSDAPDDIRLLRGDNIGQGFLRWGGAKHWPADDANAYERYRLRDGDVVIAMDRPWIEAGLKFAVVGPQDLPALLVQRVARLRARDGLDQAFLAHIIGSPGFTRHVRAVQTGTAVPHISGAQIAAFEFALPPLPLQRRIADILDAIGEKMRSNRRLIELLDDTATAIFRRRFVHFADSELTVTDALGEIPADWPVATLGDLGTIRGGGTPSSKVPAYWDPADVVWVTPKDMTSLKAPVVRDSGRRISRDGLANSSAKLLPVGTVLFTSRATLGHVAIARTELATNQGFICVEPKPAYSPEFVLMTLRARTDAIVAKANGSTFLEVNKSNFKSVPFADPPPETRREFDHVARPMFEQIDHLDQECGLLAAAHDTLLPRLVSGRLPLAADLDAVVEGATEPLSV